MNIPGKVTWIDLPPGPQVSQVILSGNLYQVSTKLTWALLLIELPDTIRIFTWD